MKILQPYIYRVIHDLIADRQDKHLVPYVASFNEILIQIIEDVKLTIEELEEDGLISHYDNINGIKMYRQKDVK